MLPTIKTADALVVSFEGDDPQRKMFVVLERQSGKFVASGLHFREGRE
jgi:hypothetical protein